MNEKSKIIDVNDNVNDDVSHKIMESYKAPEINVGDIVHVCNADGFCAASIVAAIMEDYDSTTEIIVHTSFPSPNIPTICNPNPVTYKKAVDGEEKVPKTWHKMCECKNPKRLGKTRIVH